MTKKTGFRKYVIDNKDNFDVLNFYEHFDFANREQAENTIKNILNTLKRKAKKDRQLKRLIKNYENNDYQLLQEGSINVYWSKKRAQCKAIEAAYKQKELAATAAIAIDEEAIEQIKKQYDMKRKEKEEEEVEQEQTKKKKICSRSS